MSKRRKLRNSDPVALKERTEDGRLKLQCACINHSSWSFEEASIYHILISKQFSMKLVDKMRDDGVLEGIGNGLCKECYRAYKNG